MISFISRACSSSFYLSLPTFSRRSSQVLKSDLRSFGLNHHYSTDKEDGVSHSGYLFFQELSEEKKREYFLSRCLDVALKRFKILQESTDLKGKWSLLQEHLLEKHKYELPPFFEENELENIDNLSSIFGRSLFLKNRILTNYNVQDYVFNPTEFSWAFEPSGVPFSLKKEIKDLDISSIADLFRESSLHGLFFKDFDRLPAEKKKIISYSLLSSEKDAAVATVLTTPQLDATTFLHEVGCWNGQNLLNLLMFSSLYEQTPKFCFGTDINIGAIYKAEVLSKILLNPQFNIAFELSNVAASPDYKNFKIPFEKIVLVALRVLPVMGNKQAEVFLKQIRNYMQDEKGTFILSFVTPNGRAFERKKNDPRYLVNTDKETGVTYISQSLSNESTSFYNNFGFKEKSIILNTYYTKEQFEELANKTGFRIHESIDIPGEDVHRVVVQLHPKL